MVSTGADLMQRQAPLSGFLPQETLTHFANTSKDERGAIFTRKEVVEFILDLTGYTKEQPLHQYRLLEPCFGDGDFLLPAVDRLLASYRAHSETSTDLVADLRGAIRAVEIHPGSVENTRKKLVPILTKHGVSEDDSVFLLDAWILESDFLLMEMPETFTHVIGNPPYVRQEAIPDALLVEYRSRYKTMYDRADLYVPFIERSLDILEPEGVLGLICSDRWIKNRYGGPLRAMVADGYHLMYYVDMVDTPAFHTDVTAYPAITVIRRTKPGPTRMAYRPTITQPALTQLANALGNDSRIDEGITVERENVVNGAEPWILDSFDQLAVIRRLEKEFPLLEESGCKVGIGVATGADKILIGPFDELDVEPECKLRLIKTDDIRTGSVAWQGLGVINPFDNDGSLVDLAEYPRLERYLMRHATVLRKRHVAKRNPNRWYRTIDRIYPELAREPKLLIPDIKGEANIVYEDGSYYPHHNLYYITSSEWDLKALQMVLQSGIAKLFVSMYSTEMRGGYLRFQAQYLRRIRLPRWSDVPKLIQRKLLSASVRNDIVAATRATSELYRLTQDERTAIGGNFSHGN